MYLLALRTCYCVLTILTCDTSYRVHTVYYTTAGLELPAPEAKAETQIEAKIMIEEKFKMQLVTVLHLHAQQQQKQHARKRTIFWSAIFPHLHLRVDRLRR